MAEAVRAVQEPLRSKLQELEAETVQLREQLAEARGEAKGMSRIVEKAALKPTTTNTHVNRRRNYLQYLSSEPISFSTLQTEMPKFVTTESLMRGQRGFNKMIASAILEDDEGKTKVVCTDQARKQFAYKDEKSGDLVSDPSLERLREQMRGGVNYPTLYDEVLEELDACEGDKTDNPRQAFRILRRAKFEAPFVNHVAKKAYKGAIIHFEDLVGLSALTTTASMAPP
jgi:hypothetical protein